MRGDLSLELVPKKKLVMVMGRQRRTNWEDVIGIKVSLLSSAPQQG